MNRSPIGSVGGRSWWYSMGTGFLVSGKIIQSYPQRDSHTPQLFMKKESSCAEKANSYLSDIIRPLATCCMTLMMRERKSTARFLTCRVQAVLWILPSASQQVQLPPPGYYSAARWRWPWRGHDKINVARRLTSCQSVLFSTSWNAHLPPNLWLYYPGSSKWYLWTVNWNCHPKSAHTILCPLADRFR